MRIDGVFVHGMKLAGINYTQFTIQDVDTGVLLDVEEEVSSVQVLAFSAHLASRQLVEVRAETGELFTGPFTVDMIRKLKPMDFKKLRTKMAELDVLGEAVSPEERTG